MKPCISEAAYLPGTFAADVEAFAEGGCHALEVWLTKLETHLETCSAADTRKLLDDHQTMLAAASYQGGLLLSQGEQRKAHYDHFRRRLDLCQTFAIPTMLVVADFVGKVDATGLERAVVSLTQAGQWAAAMYCMWCATSPLPPTMPNSDRRAPRLARSMAGTDRGCLLELWARKRPAKFGFSASSTAHRKHSTWGS